MRPDRDEIVRSDFPASRKGYDRDAVDAHLREVAEAVEGRAPGEASRAEAAGAKVTEIIELAERKAAEIEDDARAEAKRIVERAKEEARHRVDRAQDAVGRLVEQADELRTKVGSLGREIGGEPAGKPRAEAEPAPEIVPEPTVPQPEVEPGPVTVPEPAPPLEPEPEPPLVPEPEPPVEPEPAPIGPEAEENGDAATGSPSTEELVAQLKGGARKRGSGKGGGKGGDESAARLVAMSMALDGSAREEVEKHLAENFDVADPSGLLDDVYARTGK